jgi:RNA polymerase sigma factor (sigma-70 family)
MEPLPDLDQPETWQELLAGIDPVGILFLIERRLGERLKAHISCEDVWQEALLTAWRDRQRIEWRGMPAFRNWLIAIAERCIINAARRSNPLRKPLLHTDYTAEGLPLDDGWGGLQSTTASKVASLRELVDRMAEAVDSLDPQWREVVVLCVHEQVGIAVAAQRLGISSEACRYRLRQGLQQYRQKLRDLAP